MPIEFPYKWLHLPTGEHGTGIWPALNRTQALEQIGAWNRQQAGVWQYWLTP